MKITENWEVLFQEDFGTCSQKMVILRRAYNGTEVFDVKNNNLVLVPAGDGIDEKLIIKFSPEMFLALVDAIQKNFKPSEGKFTEGKLEATEKHLEDMRTIVFTLNKVK